MAAAQVHVRESSAEEKPSRRYLPVDDKLLDLFWSVAEVDEEKRIKATLEFLEILEKDSKSQPESRVSPELSYCIQRLINGLSSTRKASPQGFYLALAEILRSFDVVEGEIVYKQLLEFYDRADKKDKKNRLIGFLLGFCALVRSGKELTDFILSDATRVLVSTVVKNTHLEVFCITILNELFKKLDEGQFERVAFPILEEGLKRGWDSATPWTLWTILRVRSFFSNVIDENFVVEFWENPSVLSTSRHAKCGQVMSQSTFAHPNIHPVCVLINEVALKSKRFSKYWIEVVDQILVPGQKEKTYLAYELTKEIFPRLTTAEQVEAVLSPNLVQSLLRNLHRANSALHQAAVHSVNFLTEYLATMEHPAMQSAVVRCFFKPSRTVGPDRQTSTKAIHNMTLKLKPEAVKLFSEYLLEEIDAQMSSSSINDNEESSRVLQMVSNMLNLSAMQTEHDWQQKILKFFFLNGFFNSPSFSTRIKKEKITKETVNDSLRSHFRENFFRGLDFVAPTSHFKVSIRYYNNTLFAIVNFAQSLFANLSGKQNVTLHEDAVKPWNEMYETVKKLRGSKDEENILTEVFQLLLMQMALQLFNDFSETVPILNDLFVCCSKALDGNESGSSRDDDDLPWIDVLIDLLVGLLSQNQHLLRATVVAAFSLLSPHLRADSMKPVLDVLDPSRTAEGDDPLVEESVDDAASGDESAEEAPNEDEILDSSDEEVEETKTKVTDELRLAIQAALGGNAADSDKDLSEVDEEELNRLDEALAEIFRDHKKKKNPQNAETLMHFRVRCVDIIERVITDHPTLPMISCLALPLANAAESSAKTKREKPLHRRIVNLMKKIIETKKLHQLPDKKERKASLKEWKELVNKVERVSRPELAAVVAQYAAFLGSALINEEKQDSKRRSTVYSVYKTHLEKFLQEKNSHLHESFFTNFMRKQMSFCEEAADVLLESVVSKETTFFKKTKALNILQSYVINKPEITSKLSENFWESFVGKLAAYVVQVLNEIQTKADVKPMFMTELLNLCKRLALLRRESQLNEIPEDLVSRVASLVSRPVKKILNSLGRKTSPGTTGKKRKSKKPRSDTLNKKSKQEIVTEVVVVL